MFRDVVTAILAALAIVLTGLTGAGVAHAAHVTGGHPAPAYTACTSEDGSDVGQAFPCYWDAAHSGNGRGESYVLVAPACTSEQVTASDAATGTCDALESLIGG